MSPVVSGRSRVLHDCILWGCQALPTFMLPPPMCTQKQPWSSATMSPYCWLVPKTCHGHSAALTCKCHILYQFLPKSTQFPATSRLWRLQDKLGGDQTAFSFVPFQRRHMATILSCSQEQPLNSLAIDGKTQTKIKVIINVT